MKRIDILTVGHLKLISVRALAAEWDLPPEKLKAWLHQMNVPTMAIGESPYFNMYALELILFYHLHPLGGTWTLMESGLREPTGLKNQPEHWTRLFAIAGMSYDKASKEQLEKRLKRIGHLLKPYKAS